MVTTYSRRFLSLALSGVLAGSLVPATALAADGGGEALADLSSEVAESGADLPEVEQAEEGELAQSWRYIDGIPENVWLEEAEEAGITPYGAFVDVPDSYRATWSRSNGINTYTDRRYPNEAGAIITVPGVRELGVDISYYNNEKGGVYKPIDWAQMRADGVTFAIIRIGDGGTGGRFFVDPWFVRNVQGARAQGIKIGVYVYSRALYLEGDRFSVTNEVANTLQQLGAAGLKPGDMALPVYLDMEDTSQRALPSAMLGKIATAYCDALQAKGYRVGIYANQDWFKNVLTDPIFSAQNMAKNGWSRWVARYSWGAQSSGVENTDVWQFTSIGLVSGTPRKYCDVNFAFVDFKGGATTVQRTEWVSVGGKWYLRDASGNNLTGWQTVAGKQYYMDSAGVMQTGWELLGGKWYYLGGDGAKRTGWVQTGGTWYYLDGYGVMQTGWQTIGGKQYYLLPSSGAMVTGTRTIDGKTYTFDSSGALVSAGSSSVNSSTPVKTGWVSSGGKWYLKGSSGQNLTGWQKVGGSWYYLNSSGVMLTGWQKVGGTWYYLKSSGAMATGWQKLGGSWYYLKSSGAMATGWYKVGGTWYYLKSSGAMATGWYKVGSSWYYSNGSGAMQSNRWIGNYYVAGSGAMATNTWIGRYHVNASGLWDRTR